MDWYEPEVQSLEGARASRAPQQHPALFYGSSTIRLWTTLQADLDLPGALNLGFGGSTLEACAYFFDRLVVPENPGSLVLYAGDNDIGDGRQPEQIAAFFRALAAKLKLKLGELSFGFISIKPSPARFPLADRIRATNRLIELQIQEIPNAYFVNLFDAMLGADHTPRAELYLEDGLHLNRAGYQLWTKLLLPFRNRMFTSPSYAIQSAAIGSAEE